MILLMVTGILFKFIKTYFELFLSLHYLLFITVMVAAVFHGLLGVLVIGGLLLVIDIGLRRYHLSKIRKVTKDSDLRKISKNTVEISFSKIESKFNYKAG